VRTHRIARLAFIVAVIVTSGTIPYDFALSSDKTVPATANSGDLSPRQKEILRTVISADGYITQDLHREFWNLVPHQILDSDAKVAEYRRLAAGLTGRMMRLDQEYWLSLDSTLSAGRLVRSPGLEQAKQSALNASALPEIRNPVSKSIESGERMLAAVAEGRPIQTAKGLVYVTPEMTKQVLSGLEGSSARFAMLVDPEWHEANREYQYPEAHVSILSPTPFSVEASELGSENGGKIKEIQLSRRVAEGSYLSVGFASYGNAWADPDGAAIRTARASLASVGASVSSPISGKWRDRVSATADGKADSSNGPIYVSVRVVEMRDLPGVLIFLAVTDRSAVDGMEMLDRLTDSTQLLT